jgi:hypothetical protein
MRTLFLITVSVMLSCASVMYAQQKAGSVSVRVNRADLRGAALNLDMDIKIDHMQIGRYESLSLTLVLRGAGKGQTLSLPPVIVNGSNKRHMFDRSVALYGMTEAKKGAYAVLKNDPELTQFVGYKQAVPYKSWMSNCQLMLVGEEKDYHNNVIRRFTNVVERRIDIRRSGAAPNTVAMPPASNQTTRPANQTARPANQTARSANQTARPANQTARPANQTARPANQTARPANQTTRPANQTAQPANQTARPANQTARPAGTTTNRPAGQTTRSAGATTSGPAGSAARSAGTTANRPPANSNNRQ